MATLNLNEKKIPSAENLRLLSSLILSLSSKQGAIENKLINNWVASTAYIKDESFVIYDDLLYVCKISNADDTFDKNKWTCLSPTIEELSKSDVEAMLNLSQEELDNLQNLLKDDQITTTSTHSSSKIYSDIQAAIETAKEYTNEQTGKCVKPAYKVVTSTGDVTETGYFYLISNGTNYDMYVLGADGSVVSLGTSDVDLSDYAKLTDLDNYYDKTTSDGKYATITTVDEKIDKTDIATALDDTVTDEQVTSALLTKTELDKLSANLGELSDSLVDKQDYKFVVESGSRYVEDDVTQEINNWLPNDNSSILINLKKLRGEKYENFQLICNKTDSQNWECIVNGQNVLWKINYVNGVRTIQELATMDKLDFTHLGTITKVNVGSHKALDILVDWKEIYVEARMNDQYTFTTTVPKASIGRSILFGCSIGYAEVNVVNNKIYGYGGIYNNTNTSVTYDVWYR